MTGYGMSVKELPDKKISVEIKTLNSKYFDINVKMPFSYREKEFDLRNYLSVRLLRGKIDFSITIESIQPEKLTRLNLPVIENYYHQIKEVSNKLDLDDNTDFLKIILSLPDSLTGIQEEFDEKEWTSIMEVVDSAIAEVEDFRQQEGKIMEDDFIKRVFTIQNLLQQVELFENQRIEKIKKKLKENLEEVVGIANIDVNRFEQELIYYFEKIDFSEEKIRLNTHINYFFETLNEDEPIGKKLGFIIQEMGREINTLGSKANDADIQKIVVRMKDELEKIKEQSLNIL